MSRVNIEIGDQEIKGTITLGKDNQGHYFRRRTTPIFDCTIAQCIRVDTENFVLADSEDGNRWFAPSPSLELSLSDWEPLGKGIVKIK